MNKDGCRTGRATFWLPPLYFAEGLPAALITEVSLLLFQFFGMDRSGVAFWTNFLGLLPLIFVKLFCAPAVDAVSKRRHWILLTQWAMAALFLCSAVICRLESPVPWLIAVFFLAALTSGVHDIAADGFYILALDSHGQALYSGLRSVFNRVAVVVGNGGFVVLAGLLADSGTVSGSTAWSISLGAAALSMGLLAGWSGRFLPHPGSDCAKAFSCRLFLTDFCRVFVTFFQKKQVWTALLFLLLYRLGEAQLGVMSKLFLLDQTDGVGLTATQYGSLAGILGVSMMLTGGVLAGFLCARSGLKKMLLPMVLAINLPDALYVLLAFLSEPSLWLTGMCVAVEQFGYGFGFAGYMLFMVWFASTSPDDCKTSHFALMTVFMIAGIRLPGMPTGWIAERITEWFPCGLTRYQLFFLWVLLCTLPGFWITAKIGRIIAPDYGLKS